MEKRKDIQRHKLYHQAGLFMYYHFLEQHRLIEA